MSSNNIHIVNGMEAIINPENIRSNISSIDLKQLELSMMEGGLIQQQAPDPQDKLYDELNKLGKKLGINFGDVPKQSHKPFMEDSIISDYNSGSSVGGSGGSNSNYSSVGSNNTSSNYSNTSSNVSNYAQSDTKDEDAENTEEEDEEDNTPSNTSSNTSSNNSYGTSYQSSSNTGSSYGSSYGSQERPRYGSELQARTMEQQRRAHIDSVVGSTDKSASFSFEQEKMEDLKCAMLAEIDNLMETLTEENIDFSRIPTVNSNSEYKEVEHVLKILRHKNDHTRYCSFAEELLLFGSYALEELFDGKTVYFGRYNPDLTGWHNHLNVKIKRMKIDTSAVVSSIMSENNVGPITRILLELIPNMVLYSKMRSQQHSDPGLFSDDSMQADTQNIRNL